MKQIALMFVFFFLNMMFMSGCEFLTGIDHQSIGYRVEGVYVPGTHHRASLYMINEPSRISGSTNFVLVIRAEFNEEWFVRYYCHGNEFNRSICFYGNNGSCYRVTEDECNYALCRSTHISQKNTIDMKLLESYNTELCAVVLSCGGWAKSFASERAEKFLAPCLEGGTLIAEADSWQELARMSPNGLRRRIHCGGICLENVIPQCISASCCAFYTLPSIPTNVTALILNDCFDGITDSDYSSVCAINWNLDVSGDHRSMESLRLSQVETFKTQLNLLKKFVGLKYLTLNVKKNTTPLPVDLSAFGGLKGIDIVGANLVVTNQPYGVSVLVHGFACGLEK